MNRLSSPNKAKPNNIEIIEDVYVPVSSGTPVPVEQDIPVPPSEDPNTTINQTDNDINIEPSIEYNDEALKYRAMIPYNTTDPAKSEQQLAILDLLVVNDICNDETFKIFIAEPDLHKDRANEILDNLYCVESTEFADGSELIEWVEINAAPVILATGENDQQIVPPVTATASSAETMPITATCDIAAAEATMDVQTCDGAEECTSSAITIENSNVPTTPSTPKVFPIFQKNFGATEARNNARSPSTPLSKSAKDWRPIGNQQLQIDAGQKNFGMRQCTQCNMQYSVHEPEDEMLHLRFHSCVEALSFKGWTNERVVTNVMEWSIDGRIICVYETDSKAKKDRVKEILELVDRDLGITLQAKLKPKTLVSL